MDTLEFSSLQLLEFNKFTLLFHIFQYTVEHGLSIFLALSFFFSLSLSVESYMQLSLFIRLVSVLVINFSAVFLVHQYIMDETTKYINFIPSYFNKVWCQLVIFLDIFLNIGDHGIMDLQKICNRFFYFLGNIVLTRTNGLKVAHTQH